MKISWVNMAFILLIELVRMAIFIPRVVQTRSQMEASCCEWKWMAMSRSISPKDADTPDCRSK